MIQIEKKHLEIVLQILRKYPYQFYAYGSRVKGTAHQFSDLDLCYQENIPISITRKIKEEFQESNLPFRVEVINWCRMSSEFQDLIKKDLIKIT
jgi:uncharacterized protein